ncbi:hypothetical protein [Pseudobacteriovorax antillogorgiicola]|uniref:Membrane dipeptidase (Peptidase family M19) n=1 Tax=Pseudobacteriovorax antillogorgiicola TaxID=1513793 RepID=A0A1Y6CQT2_9BACT|nr:hypothetical protein [Pseudobacteriovorax antillogorgiicola]TCS42118.1 hypothetical protein EDD56_1449 [Pseudobacteriovorax antillogorgiicola]SMF83020.1 hypothetical protein SAMN06296036_1449 [Pseudobacteriovorax antillogorgiicola]
MKTAPRLLGVAGIAMLILAVQSCEGVEEGEQAYHLAQSCFAIQPATNNNFLNADYRFENLDAGSGKVEKFFAKPAALGKFLLSDRQGRVLSSHLFGVKAKSDPSKAAEWEIRSVSVDDDRYDDSNLVSIRSIKKNMRLVVKGDKLKIVPEGSYKPEEAGFRLTPYPSSDCLPYPEAALDAVVSEKFNEKVSSNNPVKGFADFHSHIAFTKTLGTVAMSGDTFHPYGIKHALNQCNELHGDDGSLDLLESQYSSDGGGGHKTSGYPEFEYWPNRQTFTHITAYYMWMKRAYLGGLRILVTNVTGNPTYCQLLSVIHLGKAEGDCKSDDSIALQTQYMYDMQDYIDAQEGGPGKGWFRIAKSSAEARAIINDNKLAVVLGTEYGTLFDCRYDEEQCDPDYIERKLTEIHDLGIRSVFPIHRFDNAFGGTRPQGGSGGAWMHLTGKFSTSIIDNILDLVRPSKVLFKEIKGNYWDLESCPGDVRGTTGVKSMKDFIDQDFNFLIEAISSVPVIGGLAVKFLDYSVISKLEPLPEYKKFKDGTPACNRKPLQSAGRNLIEGIMSRGMILEIDHMSYPTLLDTLDLLEEYSYSGVVSSHGWLENRDEVRQRIFGLGGMIAPYNSRPSRIAGILDQFSQEQQDAGFLGGVGIGTDIQGIATQAEADDDFVLRYPFKSWDQKVTFTQPQTGNRSFNFAKEGLAHYGLLPEWVENLRQVDEKTGGRSLDILMNSAEAYLQMWERAEQGM